MFASRTGIKLENCWMIGDGIPVALRASPDDAYPTSINRCIAMGNGPIFYVTGGKSGSYTTTPNIKFSQTMAMCAGYSGLSSTYTGCFDINTDEGNYYAYVLLDNCFAYRRSNAFTRRVSTTFNKIDVTRNAAMCASFIVTSGYNTSTDNYHFGGADAEPTGWIEVDLPPHIPLAAPVKGASFIGSISTARTGSEAKDLIGKVRSTQTTPGPFEGAIFGWPGYQSDNMTMWMASLPLGGSPWHYYAQQGAST
jgi:hypothetical protein